MKTMAELRDKVLKQIGRACLLLPGSRVAAAVSGGADSVALLRVLLELREELGIVLSVAHFHHQIRGAEADADQQFVRELAEKYQLEFYSGTADVPSYARERKLSLETAARELRHRWFRELVRTGPPDKVATAHTLDDQAETVLMRIVRGTGTRGLAGILRQSRESTLVRPMLEVTRQEIEAYLSVLGQPWRKDSSNLDLKHTRNRVRHKLLPLLEEEFNPAIRQTLVDLADIARAEEEYWQAELERLLPQLVVESKTAERPKKSEWQLALDLAGLSKLPEAVRKKVLHKTAELMGVTLEHKHIQQLTHLIHRPKLSSTLSLPNKLWAECSLRELRFRRDKEKELQTYAYSLPIPGEVHIPEIGRIIRAQVLSAPPIHAQKRRANEDTLAEKTTISGYNTASLLSRILLAPELTVRNWRAGDRYFPSYTHSPKKVKELLQPSRLGMRINPSERKLWPVIESAGEIVWVKGFPVPQAFAFRYEEARLREAVLIEEITDLPVHAQKRRANEGPEEAEGAK
jgi:tRNA(Ile)-lysidine synthase